MVGVVREWGCCLRGLFATMSYGISVVVVARRKVEDVTIFSAVFDFDLGLWVNRFKCF